MILALSTRSRWCEHSPTYDFHFLTHSSEGETAVVVDLLPLHKQFHTSILFVIGFTGAMRLPQYFYLQELVDIRDGAKKWSGLLYDCGMAISTTARCVDERLYEWCLFYWMFCHN